MKEEIKQLRVQIDGLSQLVKQLRPNQYVINADAIPPNMSLVEIAALLDKSPVLAVENIEDIKPLEQHQVSKCYDSLILAKAWLGKVLGELGEGTPYANDGKRKSVADIEPTADKATEISDFPLAPDDWEEGEVTKSYIEKVDWLRQEIEKIQKESHNIQDCGTPISGLLAWNFVYQHLCEARFWLGFELQRIKESS